MLPSNIFIFRVKPSKIYTAQHPGSSPNCCVSPHSDTSVSLFHSVWLLFRCRRTWFILLSVFKLKPTLWQLQTSHVIFSPLLCVCVCISMVVGGGVKRSLSNIVWEDLSPLGEVHSVKLWSVAAGNSSSSSDEKGCCVPLVGTSAAANAPSETSQTFVLFCSVQTARAGEQASIVLFSPALLAVNAKQQIWCGVSFPHGKLYTAVLSSWTYIHEEDVFYFRARMYWRCMTDGAKIPMAPVYKFEGMKGCKVTMHN